MCKKNKLKIFLEGISYQLIKLSIEYKNIFDKNSKSTGDIFEDLADQFISYYMLLKNSQMKEQIIHKLVDQTIEYTVGTVMKLTAIADPVCNMQISPITLKSFICILHNIKPAKNTNLSELQPAWYAAGLADEILHSKISSLNN